MKLFWSKPRVTDAADQELASWAQPKLEFVGAEVSASNVPPPPDNGERHSRLWVQFLAGAVEMLEDEISRGIGDLDEKRAQIADKKQQIAIHSAMHPDDSRDAEHMAAHVDAARSG